MSHLRVCVCVCAGECPHLSEILDGGSERAHVTQSEPAGRNGFALFAIWDGTLTPPNPSQAPSLAGQIEIGH